MLKRTFLNSFFWSYTNIFFTGLSYLVLLIVIGKNIDVKEFGYFTGYSLIITFLTIISGLGVPSYLIKEKNLDKYKLSNAWTVVFISSLSIIFLFSIFVNFYLPLNDLIKINSLFIFLPLIILSSNLVNIINATLLRKLKNKIVSNISIFSRLFSTVICICSLVKFDGLSSLLIFSLIRSWLNLIISFFYLEIKPFFYIQFKLIKQIIAFGLPLISSRIIERFNEQSPIIFCSVYLGAYELGILSGSLVVINSVHAIFKNTKDSIWIPILSKIQRELPERFGEIFLRLNSLVIAAITPLFLLVIINNNKFVNIILPSKFSNIIDFLPYVSFLGILVALHYLTKPTFIVLSETKKMFKIDISRLILALLLFPIFSSRGLNFIISCTILLEIIILLYENYLISKLLIIKLNETFSKFKSIIFPLIITYLIGVLLNSYLESFNQIFAMILNVIVSIFTYLSSSYLFNKKILLEIKELLKIILNYFYKTNSKKIF